MIACWFFMESCFVYVCYWFFPFVVLVVSFSQKPNCLVWVSLSTFWCFNLSFSDLLTVFKRINYWFLEAGLIRFGYRGFSFLSHAVSLRFMVFSKLRWLVLIII